MKEVVVISLGGSLIIPDEINTRLLETFRDILRNHSSRYKFVVVCGGGKTARNYINGLAPQDLKKKEFLQTTLGIASTRLNARFMTYFFGDDANKGIPKDMEDVKDFLRKKDIVFCGALRYGKDQTSDATAVKLAHFFHANFINLTNVAGLYDKNPLKNKKARFIPDISAKEFFSIAKKHAFTPGQHFVIDQTAARLINKYNIRTFILGDDLKNLDNLLSGKHFVGTIIE